MLTKAGSVSGPMVVISPHRDLKLLSAAFWNHLSNFKNVSREIWGLK